MNEIALVTGGNSGIGLCTALALKNAGCTVYEFSRRAIQTEGVHHITVDITNEAQVKQGIQSIIDKEGKIDILVNNAGYGISGAAETTSSEQSHAQIEVNLFGLDNVTRAVLPFMRANGGGRIVNISSIAGIAPIPFQLWYSVSKSAILSYTLALENEVKPFGISVCAIMPGDITTGFTDARVKNEEGDDIYNGRVNRSVAGMEHDERNGMLPEVAGRFVAKYALRKKSRPMIAMGFQYKVIAVLIKLLPRSLSNKLIGMIYGK